MVLPDCCACPCCNLHCLPQERCLWPTELKRTGLTLHRWRTVWCCRNPATSVISVCGQTRLPPCVVRRRAMAASGDGTTSEHDRRGSGGVLGKLRRRSSSASTNQGRSQQRSLKEDEDMGPDDVSVDTSQHQDSERSGRRLSSLVHGVQSLKRRLAARQAEPEHRLYRSSLDSRSSDGSELSSSGSDSAVADSNRSSLLSNMSGSSASDAESDTGAYSGPIVARARARVDYVPSPYDREALKFKKGDVIDVISKNPSGLWRGTVHGRVGTFKFINVELLREDDPARAADGSQSLPALRDRPESVPHLLQQLGLTEYVSIFNLHGYDCVEDFQCLEADQLSDLGINDPEHRSNLLGAAHLLASLHDASVPSPLCDFTQPLLSELIRDSGCFDVWKLSEEGAVNSSQSATSRSSPARGADPDPTGAGPGSDPASSGACDRVSCTETGDQEEGQDAVIVEATASLVCVSDAAEPSYSPVSEQNRADSPRRPGDGAYTRTPLDTVSHPSHCNRAGTQCVNTDAECSRLARDAVSIAADVSSDSPATSRQREPMNFERKFLAARSVFEPDAARRHIPAGVRSRTQMSSKEARIVGDEVAV